MVEPKPITVSRPNYSFEWSPHTDRFTIKDSCGRTVLSAQLQPAVLLASASPSAGTVTSAALTDDLLSVEYHRVNGEDRLRLTARLDDLGIWFDPAEYASDREDDVVATLAFAAWRDGEPVPGIESDYLVHPGASESAVLGPVIPAQLGLDLTTWLGRGSKDYSDVLAAQWGLPVHYFAGFSIEGSMCARGAITKGRSASFCLGLTEIPNGDLLLRQRNGRVSPLLRTHSELWHHSTTGSGPVDVGAAWLLTIAETYDSAIRSYYRTLRTRGIVPIRERSDNQLDTLQRPQFNTWGAQCSAGTAVGQFNQDALESIYADVRSSGLRPGIFVIDDKWEGEYGMLEHDPGRFPHFEEFLTTVRGDGMKIGLWAAFLRCDNPASHGLRQEHMLADASGRPVKRGNHGRHYYLFDVTQPEVRERLAERASTFMRRYRPSLVKFDFGYELPALASAAPAVRSLGGERLLYEALELVIGAMREVDPDLVVMYYNLSPLLSEFVDLHSTDDMYLNADEYQLEANRRLFFSSLLGEIGTPSYGSGGYDWLQMPQIWLDTVAFGPIGSLGSFHGDPRDSAPSEVDIARYNGLAALTRRTTTFTVQPLTPAYLGGSSGARSSSWARYEDDALVAVITRPERHDGSGVAVPQSIVRSPVPTAVVSRTDSALDTTTSLGLVTMGPAPVRLLRPDAQLVTASTHTGSGQAFPLAVTQDTAGIVLDIPEFGPDGSPVEWVEVNIAMASS